MKNILIFIGILFAFSACVREEGSTKKDATLQDQLQNFEQQDKDVDIDTLSEKDGSEDAFVGKELPIEKIVIPAEQPPSLEQKNTETETMSNKQNEGNIIEVKESTIPSQPNNKSSKEINPEEITSPTPREMSLYEENASLQESLAILNSEYQAFKRKSSGSYTLINGDCTLGECLSKINDSSDPLGTAMIKGYYSPIEREAWGKTKKCDSFTITGGSEALSLAMVKLVDDGNTVHTKNNFNQPVINLGLSLMSEEEKQNIFNSTANDQIELIVLRQSSRESEVPVCFAFLTVLNIK